MNQSNRIIRIGHIGCGKSEHARNMLGMTHEEYEKHCKWLEKLLEDEQKHRETMEDIFIASMMFEREFDPLTDVIRAGLCACRKNQSLGEPGVTIVDDAGDLTR